jgi:putative peptidoglycan lipid II flippase
VGLILLAEPIIRLIFERGAFTALDTVHTAQALTYYTLGLFAYSGVKIMVPVFYALKETKYPVMASFLAVAANILFISLTIDTLSFRAIALSTSCSMCLNFLFLGCILYYKLEGFSLTQLGRGIIKITVASTVMALGLFALKLPLTSFLLGGLLFQGASLLLLIAAAVLFYAVTLHFLHLPEFMVITQKLGRR